MFKFIHAADVHLDSPLRGLNRYESAPMGSIRSACRRAFENLVDLAIEEMVAFVLLSGDLYDDTWKDYNTGIFFSKQMGRLERRNIQVFVVAGNHDAANKMTKTLNNHSTNFKLLSSRKVETINIDEHSVVIHGTSFKSQHVKENLAATFPTAEKGLFNIGLLHTSLDGREGHAPYAPCTSADLKSKGYQYWALGHVHKHEIVSDDPLIVFPGCIQGRHIKETGAKGCMLVTVDDSELSNTEFRPLDVFRWTICHIDLTGVAEMQEVLNRARMALENEIAAADGRPIAMRMVFEGATPISEEISAYPERFEQVIKTTCAGIAADELWIERIIISTKGKLDLESALSSNAPISDLLNDILATPDNPDEIEGVNELIAGLRQKIPPEAFGFDSVLNLDEYDTIKRILDESKRTLIGRLLIKGDIT